MILAPFDVEPFTPTPKAPGDRVLSMHRVFVINERGGSDPERRQPEYVAVPPVTPWSVLHGRGMEAVAGVALGALILIALMFFMAM